MDSLRSIDNLSSFFIDLGALGNILLLQASKQFERSQTERDQETLMRLKMTIKRSIANDRPMAQQHTTTTSALLSGQSVTQESDLDSFLHTAELAATDFTAGKISSVGHSLEH